MSSNFHHRGISRMRAEELLVESKLDGSFLVRDSETLPGVYVLCLLHQSKLYHYRIVPDACGRLSVQSLNENFQSSFANLVTLVGKYLEMGDRNGLACALKKPVEKSVEDDTEDEDVNIPPAVSRHKRLFNGTQADEAPKAITVDWLKNFFRLNLSTCDGEFIDALKKYVDGGLLKDATALRAGGTEMLEFKRLIELAASGLQRELDVFMHKLSICDQLLDLSDLKNRTGIFYPGTTVAGSGVPAMLEKMSLCRAEVITLENKAHEALRYVEVPGDENEFYDINDDITPRTGGTPLLSSVRQSHIPISSFQVKQLKIGKVAGKIVMSINIQDGKLIFRKSLKDVVHNHYKIYQLVKCTGNNHRLDVIMAGKKKKSFVFESAHAREDFCLQIKQMKSLHSMASEIDQISVFIGTWNMGDCPHAQSLNAWLKCTGCGKQRDPKVLAKIPHSLYVFGTQESGMTDKDWTNTLKAQIKSSFQMDTELVEISTLWGIRLVILVQPEYRHYISRIQKSSVRTGIANALGNKGAAAIAFSFAGTSFCFINSHLTSGDENYARRNQNFKDIVKGLSLGPKNFDLFDVTTKFNHVFWLGDVNYRVEGNIQQVLEKIEKKEVDSLLENDQLKKAKKLKNAFCGFREAEILFMPTYRLQRNTNVLKYEWKKVKKTGERINTPSWCDRILWRSNPGTFLENVAYGFAEKIISSDHRPVFSSFNVGIASEIVRNKASLLSEFPIKIIFCDVEAQVKTCCPQFFYLEFHSTCLPTVIKSLPNISYHECKDGSMSCPKWKQTDFPEIKPTFGDQEFLEEQHLLVAVRCRDGDNESYGECVIALNNMFGPNPMFFECTLQHRAEETGFLRGQMHVLTGPESLRRKSCRKTYELVSLDTEYNDADEWGDSVVKKATERVISLGFSSLPTLLPQPPHPLTVLESDSHTMTQKTEDDLPDVDIPEIQLPKKNPVPTMEQGFLQKRDVIPILALTSHVKPSHSNTVLHDYVTLMPKSCSDDIKSKEPPPLPSKFRLSKKQCKGLTRPCSIKEWLTGLGFKDYIQRFTENGFDSLSFIQDLSDRDLFQMGISNQDNRDRILKSIRELDSREHQTGSFSS